MPAFSKKSQGILDRAHPLLKSLFTVVIQYYDCTMLYSERSSEEQFELFKKGRELIDGEWVVIDESQVVTYIDGYTKKSMHNYSPSKAVDVVPYPIDWQDMDRAYHFAGFVKGVATMMGIKVRWGGDWDGDNSFKDQKFNDLWHWEIIE